MKPEFIEVEGLWLREVIGNVQVLVKVHGKWCVVIQERADGAYSHVVEPSGIKKARLKADESQALWPHKRVNRDLPV